MHKILEKDKKEEIVELLKNSQIGIMPTDTIYGIHCKALKKELINRIYEIKKRPENMPYITLISKVSDLDSFDIEINDFEKNIINKYWPGGNTLVFNTNSGATRSFRLPDNDYLLSILNETGPLVSTSANLHSHPYAKTITEAINYFGDTIDFYVDVGVIEGNPSNVYKIEDKQLIKLR